MAILDGNGSLDRTGLLSSYVHVHKGNFKALFLPRHSFKNFQSLQAIFLQNIRIVSFFIFFRASLQLADPPPLHTQARIRS